jgi:magnesium-transporting ATPase (P-type)
MIVVTLVVFFVTSYFIGCLSILIVILVYSIYGYVYYSSEKPFLCSRDTVLSAITTSLFGIFVGINIFISTSLAIGSNLAIGGAFVFDSVFWNVIGVLVGLIFVFTSIITLLDEVDLLSAKIPFTKGRGKKIIILSCIGQFVIVLLPMLRSMAKVVLYFR